MWEVIKLQAHYPKSQIITICMDNAAEFSSCAFNHYCMALGIEVQHFVPYVHTHNGLAEYMNSRTKLIIRPLLMKCTLPTSRWGHTVLHAGD